MGRTVRGSSLDAQFALDRGYLLLVTEDIPYEERLWISLLNSDFDILDEMEVGAPYSPGILRDIKTIANNCLEFSIFGADRWQLKIGLAPVPWLISLGTRVAARSRRISPRRYMELTRLSVSD